MKNDQGSLTFPNTDLPLFAGSEQGEKRDDHPTDVVIEKPPSTAFLDAVFPHTT